MHLTRLDYGLRVPSLLLASNVLGGEEKMCSWRGGHGVTYRVSVLSRGGIELWRGWFYNRREMLVFCTGFNKRVPICDLPKPPHEQLPWGIYEIPSIRLELATVTFFTSPTGSNQTWTKPSDWDNANNFCETIGGGAGGWAPAGGSATGGAGGGGGAYSKQTNVTLSGNPTYQIGAGTSGSTGGAAVSNGGDSWFNGTTLGGSSVGSKGGNGPTSSTGVNGGAGASGIGGTKNSGGNSASGTNPNGGGGGGAAGPNGVGNNGSGATGGSGDAGSGGSAGASGSPGGAGGAGTEWDATHGSGGGGGGSTGATNGGAGGLYGAGGGGTDKNTGQTGGAGKNGIVVTTYTPLVSSVMLMHPLPF